MATTPNGMQPSGNGKKMALAILGTIVVALIIFGGGAYLFTKLFNGGTFTTFDETNTMKLVASTYSNPISFDGTIKAVSGESVSPVVDGTVSKVNVADGDKVKKGDVLIVLKSADLSEAAEDADKTYQKALEAQEQAQKTYKKAKTKLKKAQSSLKELKQKLAQEEERNAAAASDDSADTSASSASVVYDTEPYETAVQDAKENLADAQEALKAAQDSQESAREAYSSASAKLAGLKVRAPRAGTVADLAAEVGMTTAMINANGAALRIVDLDSLVGTIRVPENYVSSMYVEQECEVDAQGAVDVLGQSTDLSFDATVSKIADTPDKAKKGDSAVYYTVQLALDAPKGQIRDGMTIQAKMEFTDYGTVYYVPPSAVGDDGAGSYVEVVFGDKTTKQQEVTLLDMDDDGQAVIQSDGLVANTTIRTDIS